MASLLNRLISRRIPFNYLQSGCTRNLVRCSLPKSISSTLQSNISYKPNLKAVQTVNLSQDPWFVISAAQCTDASLTRKEDNDLSCSSSSSSTSSLEPQGEETGEGDYERLFRSLEIECRGVDKAVLQSYFKFVATAADHLKITLGQVSFPRAHIRRYTVLKSVHIHKKHRVQYEVRTHFLVLRFERVVSSTADTLLEYVQRNLPEGVAMKVTKEELLPLPAGVKGSDKVAPLYA